MSCLFCKIIDGSIPSTPVFQDEQSYAFEDLRPQAPVHILVIPREQQRLRLYIHLQRNQQRSLAISDVLAAHFVTVSQRRR